MTTRSQVWAAAEPVLAGLPGAGAMVSLVTWERRRPSNYGYRVLAALLRQASDPLAARALLQALLPRIQAERLVTTRYGQGPSDDWSRLTDAMADLVGECFAAIRRHAGEHRDDVARLVLQEATRKLRTARQAQRRYKERTSVLLPDHARHVSADLWVARSEAEWLAAALVEAVRSSRLSTTEARLVYGARVKGIPASEVGRSAGMQPKAVYYALARAEQSLLRTAS